MRRLASVWQWLFTIFLWVHLTPLRVEAQLPAQVVVRWLGPASCARTAQFDRELARLLGASAIDIEPSAVEVQIQELSPRQFRLDLKLSAAHGESERVLELKSCADLRHAAALLIATALEMNSVAPVAPPAPAEAVRGDSPWALRLGAVLDTWSLPGVSGGPVGGVDYTRERLRFWVDGSYLVPRQAPDRNSQLVADFDLFAGAIGTAYLWRLGALALGPTLAVEFGYLRARARGEVPVERAGAGWSSALLGGVGEYRLGDRVALTCAVQLSVPFWRPVFRLGNEPSFYETDPASLRVGLGVRMKLGSKRERSDGQ